MPVIVTLTYIVPDNHPLSGYEDDRVKRLVCDAARYLDVDTTEIPLASADIELMSCTIGRTEWFDDESD